MSGAASEFPGTYPVLIGTKAFAVDTSYEAFRRQSFHHDTIPSQRESLELTDVPGEGTINTEGLWRRGQVSWHHGAGQLYLDRKQSDPFRFYTSLGVDPWFEDQLSLLPAAVLRLSENGSAYNSSKVVVIGQSIWVLEYDARGATSYRLRVTTDWSSYTTIGGLPGSGIWDITTDGLNLYAIGPNTGADGVYISTPNGTGWNAFVAVIVDPVDRLWYIGDRLIVAVSNQLWDITACTGPAQALAAGNAVLIMQHPNPTWNWSAAAAGESFIYVGGGGGPTVTSPTAFSEGPDNGIYQFSTTAGSGGIATGIDLTSGSLAWRAPIGEQVTALYAYDNFIFIGTSQGIRCARTISAYDPSGNAGALISGPLIPNLTSPFNAPFQPYALTACGGMVGYTKWLWFLWPQYSFGGTTYWGLGRLDLSNFIGELQPAYASDLMVPSTVQSTLVSQGSVFWDPVSNGPGFIIPENAATSGIYTTDFNASISNAMKYVATGHLRSGRITYGMQDNKTVCQANLKSGTKNLYAPFDSSGGGSTIAMEASYDSAAFASLAPLAPNTQANPPILVSPLTAAEEIEVQVDLSAGTVSHANDTRPFLNRWTIKSLPNVVSGIYIYVALQLYTSNEMEGVIDFSAVYEDYAYLENLRLSQTVITYKEGYAVNGLDDFEATCVVNDLYWMPQQRRDTADSGFEGVMVVQLKSLVG